MMRKKKIYINIPFGNVRISIPITLPSIKKTTIKKGGK